MEPLPLTEKRFEALFFVFIFGMVFPVLHHVA
jgi:hypothetical protein